MQVSQEQVAEWLEHPITKEFQAMLGRQIQSVKDQWAVVQFSEYQQAHAKGQIYICDAFVNVDAETLTRDMNNE